MESNLNIRTTLLALSVVFLWGFSFAAIKVALGHVSPSDLVVLRFLPVLLGFLPVLIFRFQKIRSSMSRKEILQLFVLGLFVVFLYNFSLNTGQTFLPSSLAALVIAFNPASIALFAGIGLREKPSMASLFGLVMGFAGIAIVVLGRDSAPDIRVTTIQGIIITLGAPLSWGIYSAGMRHFTQKFGALTSTATSMTLGTIPLLFLITPSFISRNLQQPISLWLAVLFLSVGCTLYGFTIWAKVLQRIPAAKAGMFIYLVPITAAFGGGVLLGEPIDIWLIIGTIFVLSGVAVSTGRIPMGQLKSRKTLIK